MSLTFCLLNWKRQENLRLILEALVRQTIRPKIFLWNNAPEPLRHEGIDWLVDSSTNCLCPPRWWMASRADTEFVATLDDDLIPTDDRVFDDAVRFAADQPDDRVTGPVGCLLPPEKPYFPHKAFFCPRTDERVDLVKGRCMIVRTDRLRRTLSLHNVAAEDPFWDDMMVCGALARGRRMHHLVPGIFHGRFRNLPAGQEALFAQAGQAVRREAGRQRWLAGVPRP